MDMTVSPHSVTPYAFNYYVVDRPGRHCAQLHNTAVVAQWMCEGELGGDKGGMTLDALVSCWGEV